jgi:predicted alpha-1,6-mannanase (GH76 family)
MMALTIIARKSPSTLASRRNNGQPTWTYNQGIVLSGLSKLYLYTGDESFFQAALNLIDSVLASPLVNSSILVESCDPTLTCNEDDWMFKGVFFEHLGYFLADIVGLGDLNLSTKQGLVQNYSSFVHANAQAVWTNAMGSDGQIGNWWAGSPGDQQFGVETTGSGVAAVCCAVRVDQLLQSLALPNK